MASTKKKRKPLSTKAKKAISIVLAVVIVLGCFSAYIATGKVKNGFLSYLQVPQKTLTAITVTTADKETVKVTPAQYNYYFASVYNNLYSTISMYKQYGLDVAGTAYDVDFDKAFDKQIKTDEDGKKITWADYLQEQTKDQILDVYTYYNEAVKENGGKVPKLTDKNKKTIDDAIKSYQDSADKYGFTLNAFLKRTLGRGVNEKLVRAEMTKSLIASDFKTEFKGKIDNTEYTKEQFDSYYKENIDALSYVDFKGFIAKDEKTANKFAKELKADGSNFAELCGKYSESDFDKKAYLEESKSLEFAITKETAKNKFGLSEDGVKWLFAKDRAANDVKVFKDTIIFVLKPIYQSDLAKVDVRHILIAPETKEGKKPVDATDEQWAAAEKKANEVYNEWVKNGKTEDAFSALAKEKSTDDGSKNDGGLYKDVYPGQMVNEFGNWCFAEGRKTGDCEIVKSDFGYHIIYFVKTQDVPLWQATAQKSLSSASSETQLAEISEKYTIDTNWFGCLFLATDKDFG